MNLTNILQPITHIDTTWKRRVLSAGTRRLEAGYRFTIAWNGVSADTPKSVSTSEPMIGCDLKPMIGCDLKPKIGCDLKPMIGCDLKPMIGCDLKPMIGCDLKSHPIPAMVSASFEGLEVGIAYDISPDGGYIDESISLKFGSTPVTLSDMKIGFEIDMSDLQGYTATPVPFKVNLKGAEQTIDLSQTQDYYGYAEGWVLDNGKDGLLVMRVPSGATQTCFVPLEVREQDGKWLLQFGSIGPDGEDHRERNCFLDNARLDGVIELPKTRFIFFKGDWKTGYEIFRQMIAKSLPRLQEQKRKPCPISYNTYHDFGQHYDRAKICGILPMLSDIGFGLLHLDPGWETVWGSNIWGEEHMGKLEELVAEVHRHNLEVGCWTSVHCTDPEVHGEHYTRTQAGEKYYAEDFATFNPSWNRLWGVCVASGWRQTALANLSRLGKAGFVFLNSDFHDWPWPGDSCWSSEHAHEVPITRAQWCEELNEFYRELHRECPEMVIELHDHVESGEYRTPVWYLYEQPDSWDEKWAYEFMWSTFQDLMDKKLFSLYYCKLAEPIPMFLHMNASSDNENAIAFWYVASCVNHIGVGAIVKSSDVQRQAYKKAFAEYNARFDAFTRGEFYGIDELTHVHVYPDRRRAVILAFNLSDEAIDREFELALDDWQMSETAARVTGGELTDSSQRVVRVKVGPKDVTLVDVLLQ